MASAINQWRDILVYLPCMTDGSRKVRLVQLQKGAARRAALVDEPYLRLLTGFASVYALAASAIAADSGLTTLVEERVSDERLDYEPIYRGRSDWRLLVPADHPSEPARCLVSGTGLTHLGSATDRNAMHGKSERELTDSMRMFGSGLDGGRPQPGCVGTPPEWFYKGTGTILRAHGEPLVVPPYAEDGGEEAEIAGIYLIDSAGEPRRIGMSAGNEFSDHKFEKRNYLNLAGSKLRTSSLGPEVVLNPDFHSVPGRVAIERGQRVVWQREIATGVAEMCHSLANIEHHHFKFEAHRRPWDLHIHFYGAHSLSFGDSVELADGDVMTIAFDGYGRALRNPVAVAARMTSPVTVRPLA
jgi:hypothetical protein